MKKAKIITPPRTVRPKRKEVSIANVIVPETVQCICGETHVDYCVKALMLGHYRTESRYYHELLYDYKHIASKLPEYADKFTELLAMQPEIYFDCLKGILDIIVNGRDINFEATPLSGKEIAEFSDIIHEYQSFFCIQYQQYPHEMVKALWGLIEEPNPRLRYAATACYRWLSYDNKTKKESNARYQKIYGLKQSLREIFEDQ